MDAVTLKGKKAGFEIQLADGAGFEEIISQLEALLLKLAEDTPDGKVDFMLESGHRLLSDTQQAALQTLFDRFERFEIKGIHSDVALAQPLKKRFLSLAVHLVGGIIRSGQVCDYTGDVLFVGTLHQSGTLRATGSIFVMGQVEGLLIAGYKGDTSAVIAGDIAHAGQIRIADTYEIIEKNNFGPRTLSYINDLHILEHGDLDKLATMRPKIFRKLEDL